MDDSITASNSTEPSYTTPAFDFKLYRYEPSLIAAIIFVVVFAVLTLLHVWRLYNTRAFYFTAFTIGGVCK